MRTFLWNDYLIVIGIGLAFSNLFITNYVISSLDVIASTAIQAEGNPLVRQTLDNKFLMIYAFLLAITILLSLYVYIRRKRDKNQLLFLFITFLTFIFPLYDAVNDHSILLKILLGGMSG